jgi:AraC-like DNA-binding protein
MLAIGLGTPALFWMATAAFFEDDYAPSWFRGIAWFGLVALGLSEVLFGFEGIAYYVFSLVFVALGIWHALRSREADVAEPRRRVRLIVAVTATYITAIVIADVLFPGGSVSAPFSLVNAIGLAAKALIVSVVLFSILRDGTFPPRVAPMPSAARADAGDRVAALSADRQEMALLQALQGLMENERLYRDERLSMAVLAGRLGIPEYRLRQLIHQRLGQRNFNSFVASYRLVDVKTALADPSQAAVPILTIALDAGFGSLAPFNRAFKADAGMTPREFRRRQLGAQIQHQPLGSI